ncbi:hypothetical protein Ancab_008733, partial [Ancistrocladus abbreviatus]
MMPKTSISSNEVQLFQCLGGIRQLAETQHFKNRRADDWCAALGRSCIHITWSDRGAISLEIPYDMNRQVSETIYGQTMESGTSRCTNYEQLQFGPRRIPKTAEQ